MFENVFFETLVHKRFNIELQVQPHTFLDDRTWNSSMQRLPMDVVLSVSVRRRGIEDEPLLLIVVVREHHLEVEALTIKNLTL